MAWYPMIAVLSALGSYRHLDFSELWFKYPCVGHLSAVFTSYHHLCSTEMASASLLSSARGAHTPTDIERHSHCPHCQGYPTSIIPDTKTYPSSSLIQPRRGAASCGRCRNRHMFSSLLFMMHRIAARTKQNSSYLLSYLAHCCCSYCTA